MSRSVARPLDPELLGFLQTLINEGSSQQQERTDSDKENEAGLNTIIEEEPSVSSQSQQPIIQKMQPNPGDDGRGANPVRANGISQNDNQNMWDGFYDEEEFKKERESKANDDYADEEFEILNRVEEENRSPDEENSSKSQQKSTKKKKKRVFKRVARPPPHPTAAPTTTGGSHPDLSRHDSERDRHSNQMETMSETSGRGGRRLSRRKQVTRPRCAGAPAPGDVLQQKYEELQTLLVKPIIEPGQQLLQTRHDLRRIQGISQQHAAQTMGALPPAGRTGQHRPASGEVADGEYTILRTVQMTNQARSRPRTAQMRKLPQAGGTRAWRPLSAGNQRGIQRESVNASNRNRSYGNDSSGGHTVSRLRNEDRREGSERSNSGSVGNSARSDTNDGSKTSDGSDTSRSNSRSPGRAHQMLDTRLEHSNNPALRLWLKRKKKELRRQKAEERKKAREERAEKQKEVTKRQAYFKDSDEKVKEWMKKKRKEAWDKAKEDRKKQREEEKEQHEREQRQLQYTGVFRGRSIERPQSAQTHSNRKMFIPVIRPETAGTEKKRENTEEEEPTLNTTETLTPQPPATKFVYKRPVSGRVRLMKLQQERKDDAKKSELERRLAEKKLAEEKAKKMRMSYDQWLLKKREEDYEKRQEVARQKALAKSDPELERVVSEVGRRRIENIQRGKKRIDSGIRKINEEVNKSFGGADFGAESEGENATTQGSYRLEVSGSHKSLRSRPSSAKPALNPRISKSPRRPKSANPRVQAIMDQDNNDKTSETHPFKLPFPPENGVPKHVGAKQQKLFAQQVFEQSSANQEKNTGNPSQNGAVTAPPAQDTVTGAAPAEADAKPTDSTPGEATQGDESTVTETEQNQVKEEADKAFFVTEGNLVQSEQDLTQTFGGNNEELEHLEEDLATKETDEPEIEDQVEGLDATETTNDSIDNGSEQGGKSVEEVQEEQKETEAEVASEANESTTQEQEEEKNQEDEQVEKNGEEEIVDDNDATGQADEADQAGGKTEDLSLNLNGNEDPEEVEFEEEDVNECLGDNDDQKKTEEEKPEVLDSKHLTKHVSFQEEATVYEPLSMSDDIFNEDADDDDDEAEDERGNVFGMDTPRSDEDEDGMGGF